MSAVSRHSVLPRHSSHDRPAAEGDLRCVRHARHGRLGQDRLRRVLPALLHTRRTQGQLGVDHCLFQASFLGGILQTYNSPSKDCQIVCSKSFFGWDNELQIYRGNFLLMDSKYRKLFVTKQSKGCKNAQK